MVVLQNNDLTIEINEKGAELNKLFNNKTKKEYLWSGDEKFWGRKAPILFPIVGKLKDNRMFYKGVEYQMSQHGFARDLLFDIESSEAEKVVFCCKSNDDTKKMFPFDWSLYITYIIRENELEVKTKVINDSMYEPLYFSIGYHPAFSVPIDKSLRFEDYHLTFNHDEKAERWLIKDGLIDVKEEMVFDNGVIPLNDDTFNQDALIFKGLNSNEIQIRSEHSDHGLSFTFSGFPYVGIWSKPGASFVCIEPWHGIADSVLHHGDFTLKEGIIHLEPAKEFNCGYTVGTSDYNKTLVPYKETFVSL